MDALRAQLAAHDAQLTLLAREQLQLRRELADVRARLAADEQPLTYSTVPPPSLLARLRAACCACCGLFEGEGRGSDRSGGRGRRFRSTSAVQRAVPAPLALSAWNSGVGKNLGLVDDSGTGGAGPDAGAGGDGFGDAIGLARSGEDSAIDTPLATPTLAIGSGPRFFAAPAAAAVAEAEASAALTAAPASEGHSGGEGGNAPTRSSSGTVMVNPLAVLAASQQQAPVPPSAAAAAMPHSASGLLTLRIAPAAGHTGLATPRLLPLPPPPAPPPPPPPTVDELR